MSLPKRLKSGLLDPHQYIRLKQVSQRAIFRWLFALKYRPSERVARVIDEYASILALSQSNLAIPSDISSSDSPYVLHFVGASGFINLLSFTLLIYRTLELRGYAQKIIVCNQILDLCEMMNASQSEAEHRELCRRCWNRGQDAFRAVNIPFERAEDYLLGPEELVRQIEKDVQEMTCSELRDLVIEQVQVGFHAEAAALRFLKCSTLDGTSHYVCDIFKHYVLSAIRSLYVAKMCIETRRPDKVIMTHGIYVSWGPARELFQKQGIPVAVYDQSPVFRNSYVTSWNKPSQAYDVRLTFENEFGQSLNDAERSELEEYLNSRRMNKRDRTQFNTAQERTRGEVRSMLCIPEEALVVGLFSNLVWDAATVVGSLCFSNINDWILTTLQYFENRPDRWLIIRPHPAEELRGTNQSVVKIVYDAYPRLPPNIVILRRSIDINVYSTYHAIDAGLVYTGTTGIEMSLLGIPVITAGNAYYREMGFTIDPNTRDSYTSALNDLKIGMKLSQSQIESVERFAHMLFFRHHMRFPFFEEFPKQNIIRRVSISKDMKDTNLMQWVEAFEHQTPFVLTRGMTL